MVGYFVVFVCFCFILLLLVGWLFCRFCLFLFYFVVVVCLGEVVVVFSPIVYNAGQPGSAAL